MPRLLKDSQYLWCLEKHPVLAKDNLGLQCDEVKQCLFPWAGKQHMARMNHTGQTLQFHHVMLQDSYRLPGFYYKAGIHLNTGCPNTHWHIISSPASQWNCLCFDPMAGELPATWKKGAPRKKGSWEGSAGHRSDSSSPVPCHCLLQCWANLTQTTHLSPLKCNRHATFILC